MSTARTVRIPIAGRWYAENTREPIRDETFRAWKEYGALLETQVPTTSSVPRYQLAADFAALLNPALSDDEFEAALSIWHRNHLTPAARARLALAHEQAVRGGGTLVTFPDGTTRTLAIGPSTPLVQAVVERFAPRFLRQPVVLAVTESRQRLAYEDSAQLRRIGLSIDERLMPDVILADLQGGGGELRLVFIECVATGGAMTAERVNAIRAWLTRSNLAELRLAFGTVFGDRTEAVVRRYLSEVAWGSFAWFASEPERIVAFLTEDLSLSQASLDLVTLRAQASDEPA